MIRITLDTNVLADAIVTWDADTRVYFNRILQQHRFNLIQIVLPKSVQIEFYGILRAGRLTGKRNGIRIPLVFTHLEIMTRLANYSDLFDFEYLNLLNIYEWPTGTGNIDGKEKPLYKLTYRKLVNSYYGWNDLGISLIEDTLHKNRDVIQINDPDDYPIMAGTILENAHILVSNNQKDMAKPLGNILVIRPSVALNFNHIREYRSEWNAFMSYHHAFRFTNRSFRSFHTSSLFYHE